jgi:hypothetical protein
VYLSYPLISVIILNFNGKKVLGKILDDCLRSVFETNYPVFEVLFVDNASADGSADHVEELFGKNKKLRIIRNDRNYGFTEGNNIGIKNSTGGYIALINSDTKVDPDWLNELVTAIQPPEIGAVQSKLLQMSAPDLIDCAGGLIDYYGYHIEKGRGEKAHKYNETEEIFYAKGAGVLLKRKVLAETGFFDSEMFMYFDEVDLCWRIWLSGHKVIFAPKSVVYHASGATASRSQDKTRLYFHTRNHILTVLKNYNLENMFKAVKVSVLFEFRNALLFLIRRKPAVSTAIVQALAWNLFHLKHTWVKRQKVQNFVRKKSDKEIKKQMLSPFPPFPLYLVFPGLRYLRKLKSKD